MIHFPSTNNNVVTIALSMLIIQAALIDITAVKGAPDTTLLGSDCDSDTWVMGDPYGTLVEQMLNDLAVECAQDPNYVKNVEYSSGDYIKIVAYGSATCNGDLSEDDCKACLAAAQEDLLIECPFRKTASVELGDCTMSYSDSP